MILNLYFYLYFYLLITSIFCKRDTFRPPKYLQEITYHDCRRFIPDICYAKVVKVYDGDTITIACKYPKRGNQLYRFSVRLAGIDAPEMNADAYIDRLKANISKTELYNLVFNETVKLKNIKNEKYGRLLADVYLYDLHINDWLLKNNYAVQYNGGRKQRIDCFLKKIYNIK